MDNETKEKIQFILRSKYLGLPLSRWINARIKEEIDAYEKEHGPIEIAS